VSWVLVFWIAGVVVCDFAWRRVPNGWLAAGGVAAIATIAGSASPVGVTWQVALIGSGGAFTALLCFYAMGLMGAGDVKFAGVLGLWLGGPPLLPIAVGAGLLAGGHALFCLARRYLPHLSRRANRRAEAHAGIEVATSSPGDAAMDGAIPYAGYLALMALLWIALRLSGTPS
jgi:prepilin peptidase CpaA